MAYRIEQPDKQTFMQACDAVNATLHCWHVWPAGAAVPVSAEGDCSWSAYRRSHPPSVSAVPHGSQSFPGRLQDYDDDGEAAAGGRLLHLLQMTDARNVCVVVSRWYGGILLGPSRFAISECGIALPPVLLLCWCARLAGHVLVCGLES